MTAFGIVLTPRIWGDHSFGQVHQLKNKCGIFINLIYMHIHLGISVYLPFIIIITEYNFINTYRLSLSEICEWDLTHLYLRYTFNNQTYSKICYFFYFKINIFKNHNTIEIGIYLSKNESFITIDLIENYIHIFKMNNNLPFSEVVNKK